MATNNQPVQPVQDVSPRAIAIARQIDRLQQGTYIITLEKVDDKGAQWNVVIDGAVRVKEFKAYVPADSR